MANILVVDDDIASCRTLQLHLGSQGHDVSWENSVEAGLETARQFHPQLIVLDIRMPDRSGLDGLPDFKAIPESPKVIMITAFHDMQSTIEAMQRGADDYIHKPIDIDELDEAINKILNQSKEEDSLLEAKTSASGGLNIVGNGRAMKDIFKTIGLVAKSPATVLITGESGTGKELVARAIHDSGVNPQGPFVAVNCAALVETLLESNMFGHEKGAFTGAITRQPGKFELAREGTIFLDEISELSPAIQAKLLRVLQYKEFTPLGAKQAQSTNARIIAATNVSLGELVESGEFRKDLFYRLQVVNIHLPPLRERREDLTDLVQTLLGRINRELRRNVTHIARDVLQKLKNYHWPGNVRELENALMKAVALSPGDTLTTDLLPAEILNSASENNASESLELSLEDMERLHVKRILASVDWHKGRACEILGISRPRLRRIITQYGLENPAESGMERDD
ncbi:MAG: sigma-54-dependent Fis family transcriptional regulator [Gammaproteobacteria bacterium]|nr:sigma-54-dependent Fis family transcriptional regulator [Gammaproteobacteria bacterium]